MHNWLTLSEYADLLTISQMTPGPIALNASTFVGIRTAGIPGAIVATIGCITPSCIIVLTLAYFYFKYKNLSAIQGVLKGLRPAVVSLIGSAGLSILLLAVFKSEGVTLMTMNAGDINYISLLLVVIGLFVLRKYAADPIKVMIATGIIGMIVYSLV